MSTTELYGKLPSLLSLNIKLSMAFLASLQCLSTFSNKIFDTLTSQELYVDNQNQNTILVLVNYMTQDVPYLHKKWKRKTLQTSTLTRQIRRRDYNLWLIRWIWAHIQVYAHIWARLYHISYKWAPGKMDSCRECWKRRVYHQLYTIIICYIV